MAKVYLPQPIASEGEAFLLRQGYELIHGDNPTPETFAREAADCDAILIRTMPCPASLLDAGKKLKIVARHGVGYDNIDIAAAEKLGIWVTNTPQALSDSVAEYTLAAILTAAKRIPQCSRALYAGDYSYKSAHKGMDLSGKTLGIVGFGRIGRAVAKKAHFGLDMNILACSRTLRQEQAPEYVEVSDLNTLLSRSDVVTVHIPGGEANRNLFGREAFARMKIGSILVNVARGEVVDEQALCHALDAGRPAFAVLDVQKQEPPEPDDPLLKREDVLLTPHMASNTEECMARMALHAARQVHKVLSGDSPDWPVNHPAGILK